MQVLAAVCFVLVPGLDENSVALTSFIPYLVLMLTMINPANLIYDHRVPWSLGVFGRVLMAPFYHVKFEDFMFGDQFCSM